MRDLTLIFETLTLAELKFYEEDYFNLFYPMMRTIQQTHFKTRYWESKHYTRLSDALEASGKRHSYKRLATDAGYRQRMIDWLAAHGVKKWEPCPTLEEEREFLEKIREEEQREHLKARAST